MPSADNDDTTIAFSNIWWRYGIIARARAMERGITQLGEVRSALPEPARQFLVVVEKWECIGRHRPGHRLAELRLVLRRLVPVLRVIRRDLVTIVEERLVDHLRCGAGHPRTEHSGERQRVVRVAAEQLPQLGPVRILELVEVECADPDVSVAQPGGHALTHHEGLAERAERFGKYIGGVPTRPRRKAVVDLRIPEPAVVRTQAAPSTCRRPYDGRRSQADVATRPGVTAGHPTSVHRPVRSRPPGAPISNVGDPSARSRVFLVGVGRFELPASTSRTWRATKLRYTP